MAGPIHLLQVYATEAGATDIGMLRAGRLLAEYRLDLLTDGKAIWLIAGDPGNMPPGMLVVEQSATQAEYALMAIQGSGCYITPLQEGICQINGEWAAANAGTALQSGDVIGLGGALIVCVGWQDLYPEIQIAPEPVAAAQASAPVLPPPTADWMPDAPFTVSVSEDDRKQYAAFENGADLPLVIRNAGRFESRFDFEAHGLEGCADLVKAHAVAHAGGGETRVTLHFDLRAYKRTNNASGWHRFDVKVTSPQYPGRWHTVPCALHVPLFVDYELRDLRRIKWFGPSFGPLGSARLPLEIRNRSNAPLQFELDARALTGAVDLNWQSADQALSGSRANLAIAAGDSRPVNLRMSSVNRKLVDWLPKRHGISAQVTPGGQPDAPPRTLHARVVETPMVYTWVLLLAVIVMAGLAFLALWPRASFQVTFAGDTRRQPMIAFKTSGLPTMLTVIDDSGSRIDVQPDWWGGETKPVALPVLPRRTGVFTVTADNGLSRLLPLNELPNPLGNNFQHSFSMQVGIIKGDCPGPFEIGTNDALTGAWMTGTVPVLSGSDVAVRWRHVNAVDGATIIVNGVAEELVHTAWLSGTRLLSAVKPGRLTVAVAPRLDNAGLAEEPCPRPPPQVLTLNVRNKPPTVTQFDIGPKTITSTQQMARAVWAATLSEEQSLFLQSYVVTSTSDGRFTLIQKASDPVQQVGLLESPPPASGVLSYALAYKDAFMIEPMVLVSQTIVVGSAPTISVPKVMTFSVVDRHIRNRLDDDKITFGVNEWQNLDLYWVISSTVPDKDLGLIHVDVSGPGIGTLNDMPLVGSVPVAPTAHSVYQLTIHYGAPEPLYAHTSFKVLYSDDAIKFSRAGLTGKSAQQSAPAQPIAQNTIASPPSTRISDDRMSDGNIAIRWTGLDPEQVERIQYLTLRAPNSAGQSGLDLRLAATEDHIVLNEANACGRLFLLFASMVDGSEVQLAAHTIVCTKPEPIATPIPIDR